MQNTLGFSDLLRLIDERSAAFRAAVAAAPSLDVKVPTCPEWTLADLARHIGDGRRAWAATVAAGPATAKAAVTDVPMPEQRDELLAWLEDATAELLAALEAAGPDQGCWAWWTGSPHNAAAVARHQLQQLAVHTYDAQITIGAAEPLPEEIALDGVDEFLQTCVTTTSPWPHEPATIAYHAAEGPSWWLRLDENGARTTSQVTPTAEASATASDLVLFMYGRRDLSELESRGDRRVFERLIAWEPA
ncbi:maleylpyruvate isomerase family mycothiol-dependent enzyme [Lentzea sp. HUAS12]|uniref:maleylpyruvate isomerase family mycothiol-dependent enzyme n=1 Tax=Lentzea sp. HUAS12 TaxID=2951806 RepID=UPI00209EC728|nr:maleylpyruvate isomerase family mycothiol-dependent enzyme [Lentzea sp. HUAS12]USX49383.1 maleylpyruvate isomerase family mycothiol-dependent enzyme [Lentzea sp. HUAS12]